MKRVAYGVIFLAVLILPRESQTTDFSHDPILNSIIHNHPILIAVVALMLLIPFLYLIIRVIDINLVEQPAKTKKTQEFYARERTIGEIELELRKLKRYLQYLKEGRKDLIERDYQGFNQEEFQQRIDYLEMKQTEFSKPKPKTYDEQLEEEIEREVRNIEGGAQSIEEAYKMLEKTGERWLLMFGPEKTEEMKEQLKRHILKILH